MITDIDQLIPKHEYFDLKDRKSGELFKVDMFVPMGVGLLFINNSDTIIDIFDNQKIGEKSLILIYELFETMFKPQHNFMDKKWCQNNIDLYTAISMLFQIATPIFDHLKMLGILVRPEKKPAEPVGETTE